VCECVCELVCECVSVCVCECVCVCELFLGTIDAGILPCDLNIDMYVISEVMYLTGLSFDVVMTFNHWVLCVVYIAHVKVNARVASPINSQTVVQADS